jgi:hypothetical protein
MTNVEKFSQFWKAFRDDEYKRYENATAGLKYGTPERRIAIDAGRRLYDGEYDLTGLEYLVLNCEEGCMNGQDKNEMEAQATLAIEFIEKHKDFTIGHGYGVHSMALVAQRPPRYDGKTHGYYGRGATCVLDKPAVLLLIAEDD